MQFLLIIPVTITCVFMALPVNPDAKEKSPRRKSGDRLTPATNPIVVTQSLR